MVDVDFWMHLCLCLLRAGILLNNLEFGLVGIACLTISRCDLDK